MKRRKSLELIAGVNPFLLLFSDPITGRIVDSSRWLENFSVRWSNSRIYCFEVFGAMPMSDFHFKPHPELMSFGKLFTHIGSGLNGYAGVLDDSDSGDEPDAGNKTEVLVEMAQKAGNAIDGGTALAGGGESASAFGRIAFKTTRDIARGDKVCTGLCLVSGTCEAVALGCSTIKVIPFRGRIYIGAKLVSKGCIAFRNSCAGEGC